jgi:hypothetical protein
LVVYFDYRFDRLLSPKLEHESGEFQIYVRPFPAVDNGRWQVSTGGGQQPAWARSGRELFYWGPDGALMAVSVAAAPGGGSFAADTPVKVIGSGYYTAVGENNLGRTYDVAPDGKRFLMIKNATPTRPRHCPV